MKSTDNNILRLRKIIREELMSVLPQIIADTMVRMNSSVQENTVARGSSKEYQNENRKGNTSNKSRKSPMLTVKDILNNTAPFESRGPLSSMVNSYDYETSDSVIDADNMNLIDVPRETNMSEGSIPQEKGLFKDYRNLLKNMNEAAEKMRQ